jgi:hypothetical protein
MRSAVVFTAYLVFVVGGCLLIMLTGLLHR